MAKGNGTNGVNGALSALFSSSARGAVLRLFLLDPSRAYYQRQIESVTGLAIRAVQRELERLTEMGLLYRRTEGNRAYYQVDVQYALFPELRGMVLKSVSEEDRLRGELAVDESVELAFLDREAKRVLLVLNGGRRMRPATMGPFEIQSVTTEEFTRALAEHTPELEAFLREGVDLLGRREDVIWRRIEAAGYDVAKGKGVV